MPCVSGKPESLTRRQADTPIVPYARRRSALAVIVRTFVDRTKLRVVHAWGARRADCVIPLDDHSSIGEVDALNSFAQINLGATILQSAVIIAFAVTLFGVWFTQRRPAMRALAVYWGLLAAATVVNIFSSWSGAIWHQRALSLALTTLLVGLHGAAIPLALEAVGLLANDASVWRGRWPSMKWGGAALLVHGLGVGILFNFFPAFRVGVVTWSRTVHFLVLLLPSVAAWRVWNITRFNRAAVLLLAFGFSALALRAFIEVGFGLRVDMPELPFVTVVAAIMMNVVAMMTVGVASLLATAAEEEGVLVRQSSLLQRTQAKLAGVERFESLGRLAGGIAHDFNNVLAVISLSAEAGRSASSNGEEDTNFTEIVRATARGTALVKQLLSFARQQPEHVCIFDCSSHIDRMQGMLDRLVGATELCLEPAPTPAMVRMDPSQFDQIVLNLVVNARDATVGAGRVVVSTTVGTSWPQSVVAERCSARFVCVSVKDTGTGIPADVLEHIFEPFYSTKPSGLGTGLGLPTVQSIVHRAGGEVAVRSHADSGTHFDIYLPEAA